MKNELNISFFCFDEMLKKTEKDEEKEIVFENYATHLRKIGGSERNVAEALKIMGFDDEKKISEWMEKDNKRVK